MTTILVAEDEPEMKHWSASTWRTRATAWCKRSMARPRSTLAQQEHPDLVILDWMLPKLDGLEVCRRLRRQSIVPILMLTARSEEVDRVLGLEVGADDYLTKPFSIRELLARVRAILRRVELMRDSGTSATDDSPPVLVDGALRIDVGEHVASVDGRTVDLTPKEFDLLVLLVTQCRPGVCARLPAGEGLGLRLRRPRHAHRRHTHPAAAQEAGRTRRTARNGVGHRLPLRQGRLTSAPNRRPPIAQTNEPNSGDNPSLSRLRWQLTLSHLIAIAFTLVSMIAALLLISSA